MAKVKTINETFPKTEHDALIEAKGSMTWHDFILYLKDPDILAAIRKKEEAKNAKN